MNHFPSPRLHQGVLEFPVHHMRGGTSTGLVIHEAFAPESQALREELLRHLMGVPLAGQRPGNRQITGLGRGPATSNKVFFAYREDGPEGPRLVSTLAQLASDHGEIDWSVNCGNMSSALPLWAMDTGLFTAGPGTVDLDIRNTNTGVITTGRMVVREGGGFEFAAIPGVDGAFPSVDLFLHHPVGAKTGRLLPTGRALDTIAGHEVSCVDVAVPMVILDAAGFGKTAHEPVKELEADAAFMAALRAVWIEAGLLMGLKRRDGSPMSRAEIERSETIPKVCIVGAPRADGHIAVRYFTPQTGHASMAVSGGCCLAAAALIEGSVAHRVAQGLPAVGAAFGEVQVGIENPAGILEATVVARCDGTGPLEVERAAYRRSAQVLLRGTVPLYRASPELVAAVMERQG
ncbi:PrpF protein [Xylophilus rhododendri]|uniref:PrpF protein n=1 Tax=Xylophilus rhododendri TaxID=2697032 RepID=A0A857JD08_9BURK|nr:PrpF domain-containing protein [Xylophilus rhododendri]QHJ01092.1 PrpF protein [Xylophilus rhododendri]